PAVRVPFREISLSPTKNFDGKLEPNEPVRVYDTSGPWGDNAFLGDVEHGLPALRREWILGRGDVAEYEGRTVCPEDNGYLSGIHADHAAKRNGKAALKEFPGLRRKPLRASAGHPVSQLWYARQGIVTPEMEFIAVRENMGRAKLAD
ncbi:MAG: phosphomethylpyrimidine synthase ThiC, partial [Pirellulaceae bacterium]